MEENESKKKAFLTELSKESLRGILEYNPETGIFIWKIDAARNIYKGKIAGNKNNKGYIIIGIRGVRFGAHQLAWLDTYNYIPSLIDHIDRIPWNNWITNLREADYSLSNHNRDMNNPTGFRGVRFRSGFYEATIRIKGRITRIGKFNSALEAAEAYNEASREYYGAYASGQEQENKIQSGNEET